MRNFLLISLLLLAGCAQNCVDTYTEYLNQPWCTKDVTTDCKRKSVVIAVKPYENAFYNATMEYAAAKEKDELTPDVAAKYVGAKESFCEIVNSIGDK